MSARCTVPGCGGPLDFHTNGAGRVAETCPRCEKRAAWLAANLPKRPARKCAICDGPVPLPDGRSGNRRYCDACRPIAVKVTAAKMKANWRARKRSATSVTPIRKTG